MFWLFIHFSQIYHVILLIGLTQFIGGLFVKGWTMFLFYKYNSEKKVSLKYQANKLIWTLGKKATIHQLTTMLCTFKNVLFPGHNHLLTTGADGPTLSLSPSPFDNQCVTSSAPMVSRWLRPGNRTFLEVDSMVVSWWIVARLGCGIHFDILFCTLAIYTESLCFDVKISLIHRWSFDVFIQSLTDEACRGRNGWLAEELYLAFMWYLWHNVSGMEGFEGFFFRSNWNKILL